MLLILLIVSVFSACVAALALIVGAEAIRLARATNTNTDLLMTAALRELDALRNAADDFGHQADCIEEGVQLLLTLADDTASERVLEQNTLVALDTLAAVKSAKECCQEIPA